MIGRAIGRYQVLAKLGEGGMGEVYRARDATLNRDVAIKVLLPGVANDPDRLARFKREAQVLASLNHPNIAHVHGFEDSPPRAGQSAVRAIVMELVEGPTLADRIAQGPIPLDEALPIAKSSTCKAASPNADTARQSTRIPGDRASPICRRRYAECRAVRPRATRGPE